MADILRVATFNTELGRKGPGLLLRDVLADKDPQLAAVLGQITNAKPDLLVLQGVDYDLHLTALTAFSASLAKKGHEMPYHFSAKPNAGLMTDLDLDGDGKLGGAGDAQGYGRFYGQGSMAVLSRYPIISEDVTDFSGLLWRDLPDAILPEKNDEPFPSTEALAIQRLSSHGHWSVPVRHPTLGVVTLLTYHASPPVFDGPEDRNGKRNHDETAFWYQHLEGIIGTPPTARFVLLGDSNLDPERGNGRGEAMRRLLDHPRLQDPLPKRPTVNWDQTGPMRVDYILPSSDWIIEDAQIVADPAASRHSLVWVDLRP
ncbi:Endonuclease/exonuclease/phosphatase [Sulfitobacter noctilucicola]|uniref:Endonuclease/exonuclease/phosphatase domain-containing protein n=1 Tax=Sulfitobacter noctilucicola TaxID=1342301 RepID=A0A7W6M748_9RHOB|nr:endonuclease/exonuclease/phosphatase family protein [Sulfitobacter noctilucicola]KIN62564.1 Endonuclease/exonuclease/phosphatase [Sulfitobacter noctilucicola]MBB4172907.1 hypothetical protein [Sulfitobacter noctilucicola]